ncbi:MAG: alpha-ribazole phosphatase [Clostridiaceae bacterium]|nr:alpha-ribazole phosphatase [Clostridiaceae bacterium]
MTSLYLVRHGETDLNVKKVYYGFTDVSLNKAGKIHCENIRGKLCEVNFDVVVSSPLERAMQSAEIISSLNRSEIISYEGLKELNFGTWENKHFKELQEEYKGEWKIWIEDWINFSFPQGENFKTLYSRVKMCLEEILLAYEGKNILLVGHEGTLKIIAILLLNMNMEDYWRLTFEFGTYSMFEINDGFKILRKINCI